MKVLGHRKLSDPEFEQVLRCLRPWVSGAYDIDGDPHVEMAIVEKRGRRQHARRSAGGRVRGQLAADQRAYRRRERAGVDRRIRGFCR